MARSNKDIRIRPMSELDISALGEIDEAQTGHYRPEVWEQRVTYYLRRDPEVCVVAETDGQVVGFMLGEVRSGEFGLEEPTGWIEVMGVAPEHRGRSIGRMLGEQLLENLRQRGALTVRTFVDEGRPELSGFFAALGFEAASLHPYVKRF